MSESPNLSGQYVEVLRQLPQFVHTDHSQGRAAVHALTGAKIQAHFSPEKRAQGMLVVEFPGGRKFSMVGSQYLLLALREAAEIEISTGSLAAVDGSMPSVQARIQALYQHFTTKYHLGRFVWSSIHTQASCNPPSPLDSDKDTKNVHHYHVSH